MKEVLETTLPLLNQQSGIACWVIGDVGELNLAKEVWDKIGSNIKIKNSEGEVQFIAYWELSMIKLILKKK